MSSWRWHWCRVDIDIDVNEMQLATVIWFEWCSGLGIGQIQHRNSSSGTLQPLLCFCITQRLTLILALTWIVHYLYHATFNTTIGIDVGELSISNNYKCHRGNTHPLVDEQGSVETINLVIVLTKQQYLSLTNTNTDTDINTDTNTDTDTCQLLWLKLTTKNWLSWAQGRFVCQYNKVKLVLLLLN